MEMVAKTVEKMLGGEVDFAALERTTLEECLKAGREALKVALEALDDALLKQRPKGLRVVGKRRRSILTLLGQVTFERRYYREEGGGYRFLLDELLRLEKRSHLSPSAKEAVAVLSTYLPYRASEEVLSLLCPDAPSHTTFMRKTHGLGERYSREQKEGAEALFLCGELPETEGRQAETLFLELDGTLVNLQGEERRKGELKLAIAYEGWERRGDGEYALRGKRVHLGMAPARDFVRTQIYDLARRWDLSRVARFVVSGDGAPLAREAAALAPRSLFPLDRFHLKRAILSATSPQGELSQRVYELATTGRVQEALLLLEERKSRAEPRKRREMERLISYLLDNREGLVDWRRRLPGAGPEARGLGAIEGNVDKCLANRFKKRGKRFSASGAHYLAKVVELRLNGALSGFVLEGVRKKEMEERRREVVEASTPLRRRISEDPEGWLRVHMPALYGPHSDEPWVKILRGMSRLAEAV